MKKRGRVQKYCSEDCETRFNQQSRTKDIDKKKKYRGGRREDAKREIIKWLKRKFPPDEANVIFNELPGKAKTSMKEFERIWKNPRGYA